jgi:hypothetical protein
MVVDCSTTPIADVVEEAWARASTVRDGARQRIENSRRAIDQSRVLIAQMQGLTRPNWPYTDVSRKAANWPTWP